MKEPATAIAIAERLPPAERQQILPQVLANWATMNPVAAIEWVEKQPDTQATREVTMMIASGYAQKDPEQALRWAATLPGEHGQLVMSQVIQHVAQNDPELASSMVGRMDEGEQRTSATGAIAQMWSQSDPRAALTWLNKQPGSDATPDIYGMIFSQWAAFEVDAAVSQVNYILDSDNRNGAIRGILDTAYLGPGHDR